MFPNFQFDHKMLCSSRAGPSKLRVKVEELGTLPKFTELVSSPDSQGLAEFC